MTKTKFVGLRMEENIYEMVDDIATHENLDKSSALKILIKEGWKGMKLKKALDLYAQGLVSVDKAAKMAKLTISEMMNQIAKNGIKSEETLEEYREGVHLLMRNKQKI